MVKIYILLLCFLVTSLHAQRKNNDSGEKKASSGGGSQKISFAGTWQGIITQPGGGLDNNYAFWITIKQTKDSIHGLTRLELSNTNSFGIIEFKGKIEGTTFTIQETKITDENITHGAFWCIKAYTLTYNNTDKSLSGDWTSTPSCGPGKIYLYKSTLEFNKNKAHTNIYMTYDDFKLSIKAGTSVTGKKVVMPDVVFEAGKSDLSEAAKKSLNELALFLKDNAKVVIKILAHTSTDGDDFPNLTITVERAKAVAEYLKTKGIKPVRLQYEGFGETRPMRDNSTENGRLKNIRLEFEVVNQ